MYVGRKINGWHVDSYMNKKQEKEVQIDCTIQK